MVGNSPLFPPIWGGNNLHCPPVSGPVGTQPDMILVALEILIGEAPTPSGMMILARKRALKFAGGFIFEIFDIWAQRRRETTHP